MDIKYTHKLLKLFTFLLLVIAFSGCGQDQTENDQSKNDSDIVIEKTEQVDADNSGGETSPPPPPPTPPSGETTPSDDSSLVAMIFVIILLIALTIVIFLIIRNFNLISFGSSNDKGPNLESENETSEVPEQNELNEPKLNEDQQKDQSEESLNLEEEAEILKNSEKLDLDRVLTNIAKWFQQLSSKVTTFSKKSEENLKKIDNTYLELLETMSKLNSSIDHQQKEINRLKKGYDYDIRKNSFIPLINLYDLTEQFISESDSDERSNEKLNSIKKNITSYLDEMDVEISSPESGISYRDLNPDEFEVKEVIETEDENLNEKIEKINKVGYCHIHENGKNIIRPALITVYKYKRESINE
mgnify:CR=1 FL=1